MSRNVSMCRAGSTRRCLSAFGAMSSIATKPSVRLTIAAGASPRTMRQKMQSSGSDDPLLRHRESAHADELADGRADEPWRVVVSVAATGTVDEHDVLTTDLLAPATEAGVPRACAKPLAPLPLDRLRHGIRRGRRRARPRRVREDVHLGDARLLDKAQGPLERRLVLVR